MDRRVEWSSYVRGTAMGTLSLGTSRAPFTNVLLPGSGERLLRRLFYYQAKRLGRLSPDRIKERVGLRLSRWLQLSCAPAVFSAGLDLDSQNLNGPLSRRSSIDRGHFGRRAVSRRPAK